MSAVRFTRRSLLVFGSGLFLPELAFGREASPGATTLVCVFLRGAADGLSIVVPHADAGYYAARPSIAIPPPGRDAGALPLDAEFGLHPCLPALKAAYDAGELALVHAVGSPDPTRSHFEAQDYMDTASPGLRVHDGWLARCLAQSPSAARAGAEAARFELDAVALGDRMPLSLRGCPSVVTTPSLDRLRLNAPARVHDQALAALVEMYRDGNDPVSRAGRDALRVAARLAGLGGSDYQPEGGAEYPKAARGFRDLAALIKADLGLRVACLDVGGWDTHFAQGNAERGRLARALEGLNAALGALRRDLGERMQRVLVLVMTEFGRTVRENGTGGTDHGHGSVMLLLGGGVRGGKVYGAFPGLAEEARFEGRDLAVTTDFRDVFAEVAQRALGVPRGAALFPNYTPDPAEELGVLR